MATAATSLELGSGMTADDRVDARTSPVKWRWAGFWAAFVLIGALVEIWAIVRTGRKGDTLSEQIWVAQKGVRENWGLPGLIGLRVVQLGLTGLVLWLPLHAFLGIL